MDHLLFIFIKSLLLSNAILLILKSNKGGLVAQSGRASPLHALQITSSKAGATGSNTAELVVNIGELTKVPSSPFSEK